MNHKYINIDRKWVADFLPIFATFVSPSLKLGNSIPKFNNGDFKMVWVYSNSNKKQIQ